MRAVFWIILGMTAASCGMPDSRICTSPPDVSVSDQARQPITNIDGCIHRWAYRLAKSSETPDQVADAVIGACQDPIRSYIRSLEERSSDVGVLFRSPLTNKETTFSADLIEGYRLKAKFHVVQARAGRCKVP